MTRTWNVAAAASARERIEALLAPRRLSVRRDLTRLVLEAAPGRAGTEDALARVHDLCAKELAERTRIVSAELARAYRGDRAIATEILLAELKAEIQGYLEDEVGALAEDERLAAAIRSRLPRFLRPPLPVLNVPPAG